MRPVAVARTLNERETVVTDGVKPGEKVITDGQVRLIPGAKVEVKNAPVAVAP